MNVWLRLSANFNEHPKMLSVRKAAKSHADSAELGWYRLLMASKRYGRWTFASEEHLEHVAGSFYRYVPLYRAAGLLDDLIVHDGESYNAIKTPAERKAEQRGRNGMSRDGVTSERDIPRDELVTLDKRERVERESRENVTRVTDDGRADLEAFLMVTRRIPTPRQRQLLDGVLALHDVTGPQWTADIIYRNPDDPIGAVIEADKAWRAERIAEAQAAEKPTPKPHRPRGLPESTRELIEHWAAQAKEQA